MFKAYKYRIYPTLDQKRMFEDHFGCCRYIYNWGLEQKIQAYEGDSKSLSYNELSARLTQLKKEKDWLYNVNSQSIQRALKQLDAAYTKFLREHTGFPKFKTKKSFSQSFAVPQRYKVDFVNKTVWIPKVGTVKAKFDRVFDGAKKNMTVSKTSTGKYFISIMVDDQQECPEKQPFSEENTIGLDMGIKYFAILSDGEKVENPKYLKNSLARLKILHKRVDRKMRGSNNRKKAIAKIAKLHEKISNRRNDFQHKLSARLISENQAVAVESLKVKNMVKNRQLAQAISDAAWSGFISKLEYKAEWYGKTILKVGTFEPTSKLCHICSHKKDDLTLYDREWICPECGTEHDRDVNAAINIKRILLNNYISCANNVFPADSGIKPVDLLSIERGKKQEGVIYSFASYHHK